MIKNNHGESVDHPGASHPWESCLPISAAEPLPPVNAHIHLPPNFSAFPTPGAAVEAAVAEGIRLLGLSNYYDFTVYGPFGQALEAVGVAPLYGLEIMARDAALANEGVRVNDPANPGKIYICGKGAGLHATPRPGGAAIMDRIRRDDDTRIRAMIDRLNVVLSELGLAVRLSEQAMKSDLAARSGVPVGAVHLQERHLMRALEEGCRLLGATPGAAALAALLGVEVAALPAPGAATQDALRSRLLKTGKPAFVDENYVTLEEAKTLILALGAIPCYPVLADGASPIPEFEKSPAELVERLTAAGIHCAEFIPLRNDPCVLEKYVVALRRAGIIVSAGTEHNTPALIPLTPACRGGAPIPPAVARIFHEGACVELAHQHLTAQGRIGYVGPDGMLNGAFVSHEQRIERLAAYGHQLMMQSAAAEVAR